jgi:2-(1,2-epoxy-1,2-dihydrophenyl)acetyl-CoA isomerase
MNFDDLCYDKREGIARVAFDRPARLNALGDTTTRQLLQACMDAAADPSVRVLVITGEGEAFCAGGDFKDTFQNGAGKTADQWSERIRQGPNELVRVLQSMAKPVVASINGVAVGGGATIALACDLRIASERARFSFPFSNIGITPEFGCSHLLPRVVGLGRAMELLMLGDMIDAATAERIGLVNRVVPHAQLGQATADLVMRLLDKPRDTLGGIKSLVHQGLSTDMDRLLEMEAQALGRAFSSQEHRTAVTRFLERKSARAKSPPGA